MTTKTTPTTETTGVLEIHPNGFGFLRGVSLGFDPRPGDAYVSPELIRRFALRGGMTIGGPIQQQNGGGGGNGYGGGGGYDRNDRNNGRRGDQRGRRPYQNQTAQGPRLTAVETIEGVPAKEHQILPSFDDLTPIDPRRWLNLEIPGGQMTTRVMDMFTPIGKGQRGLIVAPPRTGKTFLIQHIADGIATNHPDVELIVLLVDERPEEVTEMRRSIRGTVFASSNDRETSAHIRLSQLVIERCKRQVEAGRDVVVLLDSITRLARAFNKEVGNTGRTMSGGLDVRALDMPKRLFGSARAFDEGGSLTIMATALIETGSRMDDVIFQEFKGTGNMEMVLDRKLADRRVFPAMDMFQSGTRKEERLLPAENLERITLLRRSLASMNPTEAMEQLVGQLRRHKSNEKFLESIARIIKE